MSSRAPIGPRYPLYAISVLFCISLVNQLDRNILASLLPLIQAEYGANDEWIGLLGSSFIWVFMLSAVPFGYLADRGSRTFIIAAGLALWSAATAVSGLVPNFASLFACRAFVGIGEAGYAAAAPSMIADYFPPARRGRALTAFFLAMPLGAGLGFALGGWLGQLVGWRQAFLLAAAPGLALTLLAVALREPPRGAHDASTEIELRSLRQALARLVRIPTYLCIVTTSTLVTFALGGIAVWLPTYLLRVYGLNLSEAGVLSGGTLMVGSLTGTVAGAWVAEWLGKRTRNALVYTISISLVITAAILPLFLDIEKEYLAPFMLVTNFFLFWHIGPINTLIANVSPPNVRGVAVSLQILTIHLLGDAFSPALIGSVSDTLQARGVGEAEALKAVLMVMLPVPVFLAAISCALAALWAPRDMHRVIGDIRPAPQVVPTQ